jgi:hypothetical protein
MDAALAPLANDGFDEDGLNGPDDPGQLRSPAEVTYGWQSRYLPPYPYPLRAIQVKIRAYEASSRQVREITITQDFLPR